MTPPRPPPRPGNLPAAEVDRTVGGATGQRRFDAPKKTLPGIPAPQLSGEHSPTIPAARYTAPTMRVQTPQGVQVVTIRDSDKTPPSAAMPPVSETPEQDALRILRARVRELEAKDRQARSASPPPLTVPVPRSTPVLDDAAVGKLVKSITSSVMKKLGLPAALAACLGLGGAGYKVATDKPAPPALTAAQLDERLDKLRTGRGGLNDIVRATNENLELGKCLRRKVNEIGGALLPAPDRMGPARKPQPYEDDCEPSPRFLPEP
jgi:hypothetical protein